MAVVSTSLFLSGCKSNEWTLMVCSSPHATGGCSDTSYIIKGYKTQKDCMEKGVELKNYSGFECGLSCRDWEDTSLQICDEICNEKGCNN